MATKGTVGVTFKLIDKASSTFEDIALKGRKTQEQIEKIHNTSKKANTTLKSFASGASKSFNKIKNSAKKVLSVFGLLGAGISLVGIANWTKGCIAKAESAEKAWTSLKTTIQNVDNLSATALNQTIDQLKEINGLVSNSGVVSGGNLRDAESALSAYGLSTSIYSNQEFVSMLADTIAGSGADAKTVGDAIAKALVSGSGTKLRKYGFTIDNEAFGAMTLQQRSEYLMANSNYKGMNASQANTNIGAMQQMRNQWAAFQAKIGNLFTEHIGELIRTLRDSGILDILWDNLYDIFAFIGNKMGQFVQWVKDNEPVIKEQIPIIAEKIKQITEIFIKIAGLMLEHPIWSILSVSILGGIKSVVEAILISKATGKWGKLGKAGAGAAGAAGAGAGGAGAGGLAAAGAALGGMGAVAAFPAAIFGAGFGGVKAIGKMYGWDVDYSNSNDHIDYAAAQSRGRRMQQAKLATKKDTASNTSVTVNIQGNVIGNKQYSEELGRYICNKIKLQFANRK